MITCNNNAFVPVCQFLEEHRLETSNLQKQWFSHHMDFLSLSTLIDCQKRQAKQIIVVGIEIITWTHTIWTIRNVTANWKLGGKCYGPTLKRKTSGLELSSMSLLHFHETFFRQISMVSYLPSDQRLKTYNNFKIYF